MKLVFELNWWGYLAALGLVVITSILPTSPYVENVQLATYVEGILTGIVLCLWFNGGLK